MSEHRNLRAAMAGRRGARQGPPRWAWWLILGFPALFTIIGIGAIVEAAKFAADAESTRGEVVRVERNHDSEGGVSYSPLIRYRNATGRSFEAGTHISSSEYDYDIGERVEILYSMDDPETVRVNSFFSLYGFGLIFALIGGIFVAIMLFVRRKMFGDRSGGSVLARAERAAAEKWRQSEERNGTAQGSQARTTDPSIYGHAHEPKPKHKPSIRRMR